MGPGIIAPESTSLPSRPRFSWDAKTVPWTDGKGIGSQYLSAVKLWKLFNDTLPDNSPNKIPKGLQGIILKSQLYGRASDLGSTIKDEDLMKEDGVLTLAKAVYKTDSLSKVSTIAENFNALLKCVRGDSEKLINFERRFESYRCKFNDSCGKDVLPDSLVSLMMINNAGIDSSQRIALLTSIAPDDDDLDGEALLKSIDYSKVSSIIRSSDNVTSNSSHFDRIQSFTVQTQKPRLSRQEIHELKKSTRCAACGQVGQWQKDPECPKNKEKSENRNENNGPRLGF